NWGMFPKLDLWAAVPDQAWWPHLLFAIQEVFLIFLIVGFMTRFSCAMVLLFLISTQTHVPNLFCASDRFEIVMLLLMCFSNAGDAFSVDALREHGGDWYKAGFGAPPKSGWATRMMQMQLVAVYFHTSICKIVYPRWYDGSIMYYTARWHE